MSGNEKGPFQLVSKWNAIQLGRADLPDGMPDGVAGPLRGFAVPRQMAEGKFDSAVPGTRLELGMAVSQNR